VRQPLVTFELDPEATPVSDFRVTNHGTLWTFTPLTLAAADWWDDHVHTEQWQRWGGGYAVDQHMVDPLIFAITQEGLRL
jgi:hypothetical protein